MLALNAIELDHNVAVVATLLGHPPLEPAKGLSCSTAAGVLVSAQCLPTDNARLCQSGGCPELAAPGAKAHRKRRACLFSEGRDDLHDGGVAILEAELCRAAFTPSWMLDDNFHGCRGSHEGKW